MITEKAKYQISVRLRGIVSQHDICCMNSAALLYPEGKNYVIIRHLEQTVYRPSTHGDMLVVIINNGDVTNAMLAWNTEHKRWTDGTRREFTK